MAEAITLLGAAAAALQVAEMGYKVIAKCSSLVRKYRESPECLQRTHSQIQHLIYLAKVATENYTGSLEHVTTSEAQPVASEHQQPQSTNNQPQIFAPKSFQLEDVWKDCYRQAETIDNILQSMMQDIDGRGIHGKWRKFCLQERLNSIEAALSDLERSKTTLGLWLGNESLSRIGRIHHDLAVTQDRIVNSEKALSLMFEVYCKKTENAVLTAIQQGPAVKLLDHKPYNKQKMYPNSENGYGKSSEYKYSNSNHTQPQRNVQDRAPQMTIQYSAHQESNFSIANSYLTSRKRKYNNLSNVVSSSFNIMKVEWQKVFIIAGNNMVIQFGTHGKKPSKSGNENEKNVFLNLYLRLRSTWLFDLVDFHFSLQQFPGGPSVQASLKTHNRVKSLPRYSFFLDIYGTKPREKQHDPLPSKKKQEYLFLVARKLLMQSFDAGDASPNDIDVNGRTLLHLQTKLYRRGYETLFIKMTEFLRLMDVDTDVLDNELKTAQNTLCDTILLYHEYGDTIPDTFTDEARLSWTSPLKVRKMRASDILRCIQCWPEAILDTGYERICDIVLRRSIDDLETFEGQKQDSGHRGEPTTPLHFAVAASWLAGVETLISLGYSRFRVDGNNECPVDIAIDVGYIPVVNILLAGDCMEFLADTTQKRTTTLPRAFIKAAQSADSELHEIVTECLSRHKFLLPNLLPYHDLARQIYIDNIKFAKKLFIAGFQDTETYENSGCTPLMVACAEGNIRIASFLMQHGADLNRCHEHLPSAVDENGFRSNNDEKKLLGVAFDTSVDICCRCRCSPDGFSPISYLFFEYRHEDICSLKESIVTLIRTLDPSPIDSKRYWRAFVISEIFHRLGMTHTCIKGHPKVRLVPDHNRIGIEDEEEDLFFQLQEFAARYDLFSDTFGGDVSECVDVFFDDLDGDLRPRGPFGFEPTWPNADHDCLGPGEIIYTKHYMSSRAQKMEYGYQEIVKENSMLRWLF